MLLICPACHTRYVVPDAAIGAAGRQVRCASCKHSWFQQGPELTLNGDLSADAGAQTGSIGTVPTEEPPPPPITPPRYDRAETAPRSSFAHEPPFRPRRNPARLWTIAAVLFALLIGVVAISAWQFADFSGNGGAFAADEPALAIVLDAQQDRQTLTDGTEYFAASGTIVNGSAVEQKVPSLLVVLKDAQGRTVYSWTMKPPVRVLAPGGKAEFNEAKLDVPRSATELQIGWARQAG